MKIQKYADSIAFVCLGSWKYNNANVVRLWDKMNSTDKKIFNFNVKNLDWKEYFIFYTRGIRVYLLKESMDSLGASIARYRR